MPAIELCVLALAIALLVGSYLAVIARGERQELLTPPLVASILVANLLACGSLIVLLGRRVAKRRAAKRGAGEGKLHVRLVAIFSLLASIPTVLLAVIASLLFQYGAEFWFSGRARGMLENAQSLAQASYSELVRYVDNENVAMATDISNMLFVRHWKIDSEQFHDIYEIDVRQRSLSNSVLFSLSPDGAIKFRDRVINSDTFEDKILPEDIRKVIDGHLSVANTDARRTYSLSRVPGTDLFLYSTREGGAQEMAERLERLKTVFNDYRALLDRSRMIQLRFNIALLLISLLVIAVVVFVALEVADRLVRPVNELVGAARRVAGGDLTARVPVPRVEDEIGALATAFNQMTLRLEEQTGALESRRALIEAVMSGVSAGVLSIAPDGRIRLLNASACALLKLDEERAVGAKLTDVAPELAEFLRGDRREAIVQLTGTGDARTLAVRVTGDEGGLVLTFDDMTQQLLDQRRAAWSDVARRIAHEIKNPLTPIQLAAERLQRRYGGNIDAGDTVFGKLTDTIVRQVGDLRRMVDEFSSFARMPKPVFHEESLVDLVRQALFLHEVAHPRIAFDFAAPDLPVPLICDRRQISQALTNIVKNAVEAIEARGEGAAPGKVAVTLDPAPRGLVLAIADNGIGLPTERERIAEPYMTTRARGTGLGLAIVKKIVEEHCGTIQFGDRPGGGTIVTIAFDTSLLAATIDLSSTEPTPGGDGSLAVLTRNGRLT
ncbi:ATP-binding protein [uncultured Sphingomonas sp.]|uniref:sensor histidine kinase NtrY-like n=1 Tax=uncultured Sphingomonas sp. TaxID=158754 RepID=UPI0035CABE70